MKKRIYLSSPHMSDEKYEEQFVKEAFESNWIAPLGPQVDLFEQEFAEKVGAKYAVALNSGTSAIHLSLKAANIKEGDIVICQSLTFSATANPILYEKAIPVFIDSDESWNISPKYLEEALIKYPNAKAVIVVHLYGICAKLDEIIALCKKYNVILIEDAAESLGSLYKGKYTGTFGDYGIFSFNGNKIITTSGGGMLVTNDKDKADKIRFWATQAREKELHYEHKELGYNYRLSNILAAIGRGQLKVLDQRVIRKREIYDIYKNNLKNVEFMPRHDEHFENCWLTSILVNNPLETIKRLNDHNIEARPLWKPMHLQPFYKKYDFIGNGYSNKLFEKGLCLPSDTKIKDEQQNKIINIMNGLI